MRIKYVCDFCEFYSDDSEEVSRHEEECLSNPANKACNTCKYYTKGICNPKIKIKRCALWEYHINIKI